MFRVSKQARSFLADMHDRVCEQTANLMREQLLGKDLPHKVRESIDRVATPENFKQEHVLRVVLGDDDWPSLKPEARDRVGAGDRMFKHGDRVVLVIDEALSHELGDLTIEVFDAEDGPRIRFRDHSSLQAAWA